MREIKFRCFVPAEGDYYYIEKGNDCWIQFMDDKSTLFIEDEKWESGSGEWVSYPCIREVEDFILEQFTGFCDKNGKEIYEGDIIQSPNGPRHTVKYIECSFVAMFTPSPFSDDFCGLSQKWITDFKKEIIGNIHENPELLK